MNQNQKPREWFNAKLYFMILLFFFLTFLTTESNAIACQSCGRECASACGTKHFRTCCFNYLRKRSDPTILKTPASSLSASELENQPALLLNSISDEQLFDPNMNYHVLEQILDDIRHDSKTLEMEVRKAISARKTEYDEKKHRLQQLKQQQQQHNSQQKEMDYAI